MSATWYVTEAGVAVDPAECRRVNGALTHKSGARIAMRFPDCPRSRSVDPDAERAKAAAPKPVPAEPRDMTATDAAPAGDDREMKPGGSGRGYRTRSSKAD